LILGGDLERERLVVLERRPAIEAEAGNAGDCELDRQHVARLARRIIAGRPMDGFDRAVGKSLGIEPGGSLGVLVVPEADRVLRNGHLLPLLLSQSGCSTNAVAPSDVPPAPR